MSGLYIVKELIDIQDWHFCIVDNKNMSFPDLGNKYLKYRKRIRKARNTVKQDAYALSYYFNYLDFRCMDLDTVLSMSYVDQNEHFCDFLDWLCFGGHKNDGKYPCNSTCNHYLGQVFEFYSYIVDNEFFSGDIKVLKGGSISITSKAGVRIKKTIQRFEDKLPVDPSVGKTTSKKEIITLVEAEDNLRNKLLLLLLADTGIRVGEVLGILYAEDIDYDERLLKVVYRDQNENGARAKNAEYRTVRFGEKTYNLLMHYIAENAEVLKNTKYLFFNMSGKNSGKAMKVGAVYSFLNKLHAKTGIKITPHMLRHYFANERRKIGTPINVISEMLGHKRISTTEKYFNIELEETVAAQDRYFEKQGETIAYIDSLVDY